MLEFKFVFQASEKRVILMVKLSIFVCGLFAAGLAMATSCGSSAQMSCIP